MGVGGAALLCWPSSPTPVYLGANGKVVILFLLLLDDDVDDDDDDDDDGNGDDAANQAQPQSIWEQMARW